MKRSIIHTAFREGTKLSEKVWTTSQDPHLFLTATQQNQRGGAKKRRRRCRVKKKKKIETTMQWLLFGAEKGEVSWSNLSSPCESCSRRRHWQGSPEAGLLAPGQSAASIGPVCKCLQVSFSCDRGTVGGGEGMGQRGREGRARRGPTREPRLGGAAAAKTTDGFLQRGRRCR